MIDRDAIVTDAVNGDTTQAIARRHGCTVNDVHTVLDEYASEVLTPHNRARLLVIELQRLDELHRLFHRHALENQDAASGTLCCKLSERKASLLGLNAPTRIDATQLVASNHKNSTEEIEEAINRLCASDPKRRPDQSN